MYCWGCGYDLAGSPPGPCPECGRAFDPRDAGSFSPRPAARRWERRMLLATVPLVLFPWLLHIWLHLMLVVARFELGRWPHRMGMDDPKYIPRVDSMHFVASLGIAVTPLALLILAGCIAALLKRNWRLAAGLACLTLWSLMLFYLVGDPAQVWVWFFD